ncbi:MAG: ComEC/Rec2 family competence protein [Chthoniobacteraceae bacterium]
MLSRPRQPLALHALCAIGGIVAADQLNSPHWAWAAALGVALWIAWGSALRKRKRTSRWLAAAATFSLFFAWNAYRLTDGPSAVLARTVPPQGCVVKGTGIVDSEPDPERRFHLQLEALDLGDGKPRAIRAPVLVRWNNRGALHYGDRIEFTGDLHPIPPPRNPGVFDSPAYWRTQGITCELRIRFNNDVRLLEPDRGRPFVAHSIALRHWLEGILALDLEDSPDLTALIQSMVLGSQGDSMEETRALFQYTGTMHLFAVSGMNVAMLAAIATSVLMALGLPRRTVAITVIPLLWAYCYATGLTPSSLRATVMATVYLGGLRLNRFALSWNTLGASALVLLVANPGDLFTSGFQLSFLMVAFLFLCVGPIQRRVTPWVEPDPFLPRTLWSPWLRARTWGARHLAEGVAVSSVAWLGSTPLMIHYFHLWSPSTVPANLIAALLTWGMLVTGLAAVSAGVFCKGLAIIFNNANWLIAKTLLSVVSGIASVPYSHVFVEVPSPGPTQLCEVEALDLPGGAAIHVRINSKEEGRRDWLVDCGNENAVKFTVAPYLRSRGVNRLQGVVLTHGDAQHIAGLLTLLKETPVEEVVDSYLPDRSPTRKAIQKELADQARGKSLVSRGDRLTLAPGVTLHVLFPPEGLEAGRADDKALVLRLDAAGRRILLSSDAGFRTESWLLENAAPGELRADAWIKQNHATDLSGTPDFLEAAHPSLIVASGAAFPAQERLKEEWVREVQARGIRLLRQDLGGAASLRIGPKGEWSAGTFLSN